MFNKQRQDKAPEKPEFPTVDVAYAKIIAGKRRPKKRRGLPLDDED